MIEFIDYLEFKPDYSPVEMFDLGIFGASYFHNKKLNVDGFHWRVYVPKLFIREIQSIDGKEKKAVSPFLKEYNKYKVDCGSSYEDWNNRGWINNDLDPYGWVNWYINFYYGRRVKSEDEKQIKRWKQFKSRHLGMLKSRGEKYKLPTNNLKTKQNLLHWAINWEIN